MYRNFNNEQLDIVNSWFSTDKFENFVLEKSKKYGVINKNSIEYTDYYDCATKCFLASVKMWDSKKSKSFNTYFSSNLDRKFKTLLRDKNRLKNGGIGGFTSKHDNKSDPSGEKRYRERELFEKGKRSIISLDASFDESGKEMHEIISNQKYIPSQKVDNRFRVFDSKLTTKESNIVEFRLQGESDVEIQKILNMDHVTFCRCADSIREKAKSVNIKMGE